MLKDVTRIIFDLDGTLIKHDFDKECEAYIERLGVEEIYEFKAQLSNLFSNSMSNGHISKNIWRTITMDYYTSFVERTIPLLKQYGKTGKDFINLMYDVKPGSLMPQAKETLGYLNEKGYELVVLTNWFYNHQVAMLKHFGIMDYFERVYAWDNYYAKPNRLSVLRALGNSDALENVLVGDSLECDIIPARNCGIKTIGLDIDYCKYRKEVRNQRANINIANLSEIRYYL